MQLDGEVSFNFTNQSIAAGATFLPLDGWQYEFAPQNCRIEVLLRAAATGVNMTLTSAGRTLVQESGVNAGGTAGQLPSVFNTPLVAGRVNGSERIRLAVRNTTAGPIIVDGTVTLIPVRGR